MSRILLLMENRANRLLVEGLLSEEHRVVSSGTPEDPSLVFDLCLLDDESLERHREGLQARVESEAPVFLPILLVTAGDGAYLEAKDLWVVVDGVIRVPVSRAELTRRIDVVLRARHQSLALQEQLMDAQRMEAVAVLAGGIIHDLNNLLTVIRAGAGLLAEDLGSDDTGAETVRQIAQAVEQGSGLTRQLLRVSRRRPEEEGEVDLAEVVATTVKVMDAAFPPEVEVIQEKPTGAVPIGLDPVRAEQVVMNLVVNAAEAMPDGGRIILGLEVDPDPEGGVAVFTVSDTGSGMDEVTRASLFDAFFTTKESGTGLGLATVHRIVQTAGGSIEVESEPGEGTTFRIRFPLVGGEPEGEKKDGLERVEADDAAATAPPPTAVRIRPAGPARPGTPGDARPATILVVDDERSILEAVEQILTRGGYHVLTATDAGQALRIFRSMEGKLDLLLTDSILPDLKRTDLVRLVRKVGGHQVRVAFMSGYNREEVVDRLGPLGDAPFIPKPFSVEELLEAVERILAPQEP